MNNADHDSRRYRVQAIITPYRAGGPDRIKLIIVMAGPEGEVALKLAISRNTDLNAHMGYRSRSPLYDGHVEQSGYYHGTAPAPLTERALSSIRRNPDLCSNTMLRSVLSYYYEEVFVGNSKT